jgi:hypothetical protein
VPNQTAGDEISFWARRFSGESVVEVRYSPGGGTQTGTLAADVGDFTVVLAEVQPTNGGWTRHSAAIPGSGRIALRYRAEWWIGNSSPYTGIDTLSVGPPPPPPCNQPPVPQPGQTLAWTLAGSPYTVCQNITIPAGATVNVEPGVVIDFNNDRQLAIEGTLNINGTAFAPVIMNAPGNFPPFLRIHGTLNAHFTDFRQQVRVSAGANVLLQDCIFTGDGTNLRGGMLTSDALYDPAVPYVLLERCTFTQTICILSDCLVSLRNSTFNDTTTWLLRGFADVSAPNTFNGKPLEASREEPIQGGYIDGVNATGITQGGGLRLSGGSWLLGSANQLTGNEYPLAVSGGLMPGSTVPETGNIHNAIDVGSGAFRGDGRWPLLSIPYRTTAPRESGGRLLIDPGVTVQALPNTGLAMVGGRPIRARGTPADPIRFESAFAGQTWSGLVFDTNFDAYPHLENCIFQGAAKAIIGVDTVTIRVDHCRFENNEIGTDGGFNTRIALGKTLFSGNAIGARRNSYLLNQTNPNAFEGNAIAVEGTAGGATYASLVWWNSASGPSGHPQNPGGTGDPIGGYAPAVSIMPFLTTRPDFADTPPIVRLQDPGLRGFSVLKAGERHILTWDAEDDGGIIAQTVMILGGEFGPQVLAQDLPGDQRMLEITIPEVGFEVLNTPQRIRIDVTDTAGQIGSDQALVLIPSGRITGHLEFTPQTLAAFVGQTFTAAANIPGINFSGAVGPFPSIDLYLVLDADSWYIPGYANSQNQYGSFNRGFPHASTDLARLALRARNNSNDQKWFYSEYFSIRHDPRLGLEPPQVELLTPAAGAQFPGGSLVPVTWNAAAAQGLYSFDIQASFDGGIEWHMVARELPAEARAFQWQLPASAGIPEVRLRVIARDRRFQNSSSGMERAFSITPGSGPQPCYANCDNSTVPPILNVEDFSCFVNEFAAAQALPHQQQVTHYANCDESTTAPVLNVEDFSCFINRFAQGCP